MKLHMDIDLRQRRRVLTCGDVHGNVIALNNACARMDFDPAKDTLVCLGDWLDRGPAVMEIRDWILANRAIDPLSVLWTRGNHEELLERGIANDDEMIHLMNNGGAWVFEHMEHANIPGRRVGRFVEGAIEDIHSMIDAKESVIKRTIKSPDGDIIGAMVIDCDAMNKAKPTADLVAFSALLSNAPVMIRVHTPKGRKIGFAHADIPGETWTDAVTSLDSPIWTKRAEAVAIWSRERINTVKAAAQAGTLKMLDCSITGVDLMFFGHTVVKIPVKHGNCIWIDTGAFKSGNLTMIDVDQEVRCAV